MEKRYNPAASLAVAVAFRMILALAVVLSMIWIGTIPLRHKPKYLAELRAYVRPIKAIDVIGRKHQFVVFFEDSNGKRGEADLPDGMVVTNGDSIELELSLFNNVYVRKHHAD